jgi:very-short-patch-repair endonuclease
MQIHTRGFRILPQYEVAGYRIDLVVEGLKGRLAVECDGDEWHGPDRYESDMSRQRDLVRCGWVFVRIRGSDFYRDSVTALSELWETLERLKISPRHAWESERRQLEAESRAEQCDISARTAQEYDRDVDNDEDDLEQFPPTENTSGRLDRALEFVRLQRRRSEDLPPLEIQHAIVQVLEKCPNHTCTLKSLTSRVLKQLGILTRGNPRLAFEKRVMRNLGPLKRKELVEEYKAKNKRIRLAVPNRERVLFE